MRTAVTISLVPEARGGPFVFWDDLRYGIERAAAHGFDAVEIFAPSAETINVTELRAVLSHHQLEVAAFGTGAGWVRQKLRLTDPDPTVRHRAVDFIADLVELGAAFQAPAIIGSMQGRWGEDVSRDQALEWLGESLMTLSRRAEARGVPLLYEPLNRYETNLFCRTGDAAAFLRTLNTGNVKLLCDLFHMNIEEASIAHTLRETGNLVGHVHWADSNRQAVGFGHTDAAAVHSALQDIRYDGYLSAEILPLPDADTAAAQTMRSIRQLTDA